jgi:hypothetical protein
MIQAAHGGSAAQAFGMRSSEPVLYSEIGEGIEVVVGRENCRVHRAGQRGEQDVHL